MESLSLHRNELALCHIIEKLVGKSSGSHRYSEPIGKKLQTWHQLPIVDFDSISTPIYEITPNTKLVKVVKKNSLRSLHSYLKWWFPQCLANKNPGKLSHVRWPTTGNFILRLYVETTSFRESQNSYRVYNESLCISHQGSYFHQNGQVSIGSVFWYLTVF